jgi:hypothetical protein
MKRVLSILSGVFLIANMLGQTNHYVGESYGGGIVFHVSDGGKHGLITATVDRSARIQRQNNTSTATNAVTDGIGADKFNTERISAIKGVEDDDVPTYFKYQDSYYRDWYLPSKYELNLLYLNRSVLGGYADFARAWSSTMDSRVNAWFKSFAAGSAFTKGNDNVLYVRVHRRF